jgi:SHS2 domain-containing protein
MEARYEYIDHTADVLFKAYAESLEELFSQCALALENTQVDVNKIESKKEILITGTHKKIDGLLFDFLDDLLFYKDAELLIFNKYDIKISEKEDGFHLECKAFGEILNFDKHDPKVDVKAITMHMFEVVKVDDGWMAQVLVDI